MDGVIDIDKARELVGNAALWPHVRDFLWDFAPSIHESWIESLKPEGVNVGIASAVQPPGLQPSASLPPRVRRYVLDSLGVEPCFHDFPKEDGSRLLLVDGKTLASIVRWLGALACAAELRRVTDGATVRALKAALPGVYPEVFGYTAYFSVARGDGFVSRRDAETQSLADQVVSTGFGTVLSSMAGIPASLVSRLKFKLPRNLCASAPLREETPPRATKKDAAVLPLVLKLLKLKFPEAYSLCCS